MPAPYEISAGAIQFGGQNGHLGIGYQNGGHFRLEGMGVFAESKRSAWTLNGWLGDRAGGGVQLGYQWLPAGQTDSVWKTFAAFDRNASGFAKATFGAGVEREQWSASLALSHSVSGRQLTAESTVVDSVSVNGNLATGQPFIDTTTTLTTTRAFTQAYEQGVGARVGRFDPSTLIRLSGGLDYEWGKSANHQVTASVDLEKYFEQSPHSLALHWEFGRKSGEFVEHTSEHRAQLVWRYALGGHGFARQKQIRMTPYIETVPARMGSKPETVLVKHAITINTDAFFDYGKYVLRDDALASLAKLTQSLRKAQLDGMVKITGHTCDLGSDKYNLALSKYRADRIKQFLIEALVVQPDQVMTEGKGKREPKYPSDKDHRHLNRRVDIEFVTVEPREELRQVDVPVPAQTHIAWREEEIETLPTWARQSLRTSVSYKQSVDTYVTKEVSSSSSTTRKWIYLPPQTSSKTFAVKQSSVTSLDVLQSVTDPNGDTVKLVSVSPAARGTIEWSGKQVVYTAPDAYLGSDSFTYVVENAHGKQATGLIYLDVTAKPKPPVANEDAGTTMESQPKDVAVLANDSDPDGGTLLITSLSTPAHGQVSIANGSMVRYTPAAGFTGTDEFTYTIRNGDGMTASAKVLMNVIANPALGELMARNDLYYVPSTRPSTLNVLLNDLNSGQFPLRIVALTQPQADLGAVSTDGQTVTFTPTGKVFTSDVFTYTIRDSNGRTSTATVTLIDP
ncbi:tandem-95 repeat protein [Burkholderiaceae bacterium DAT-1]|nr:tandem-95 repeat protein [Burkholderiaceae bacterium DAT-1]